MEARPVDPRDTERVEDNPVYRVYFWGRLPYPAVPSEQTGYRSEEYELSDVDDVREVLSWAQDNAVANRTFTVYALLDGCAIRLFGSDPTQKTDS